MPKGHIILTPDKTYILYEQTQAALLSSYLRAAFHFPPCAEIPARSENHTKKLEYPKTYHKLPFPKNIQYLKKSKYIYISINQSIHQLRRQSSNQPNLQRSAVNSRC